MKIYIPNNFVAERTYIIETIFEDFLALDIELNYYNKKDYQIILDSNKKIIIKDDFWGNIDEEKAYLFEENIPTKVNTTKNPFIVEKDIPIIYGDESFSLENEFISCGIDIFASSFFMLTRWEEFAIKQKDKHKRFPCSLSLAQKNNIHFRPIVNEYVEMLWNMLKHFDCQQKRKEHKFQLIPTHDIDFLFQFDKFFNAMKVIGGDILKRLDIPLAFKSIKTYLKYILNKGKDPFDTFDFFMDIADKHNVKSRFYFIAGEKGEYDVRYKFLNQKTKKTLDNIQKREHIIGIHGTYNSYNNQKQFEKEIKRFEQFGITVNEGRQHYLRFENPKTWNIWNNSEMKYDYTIGYANDGGFRAGTCFEYRVFDILERKKLNLIERPLIAMETAIRSKYKQKEEFEKIYLDLKEIVKKYNGKFVFLWHNSNLNTYYWYDFVDFYSKILK